MEVPGRERGGGKGGRRVYECWVKSNFRDSDGCQWIVVFCG